MRVLMVYAHAPAWRFRWTRAASRIAEVISLRTLPTSEEAPVEGSRFLSQNDAGEYVLRLKKCKPEVVARPLNRVMIKSRWTEVFDLLERRHGRIDLMHAHFYSSAEHLDFLGRPYVVSEHTSVFTRPTREIVRRRSARVAQRVYDAAEWVLPVSESLKMDIQRAGVYARFRVVPNAVDTAKFAVHLRKPPKNVVRLVTVGRLAETKGLDVVIRALKIARVDEPRLRLRVVGEGPLRVELEQLARRLGVGEHIEMVGQVSEPTLVKEFQGAHLLVAGSRGDSFGLPIIEALSTGLPVVATHIGIAPECIGPHQGILVRPERPRELALAILEMVKQYARYDPIKVSEGVHRSYSFSSVGEQLGSVYEKAVLEHGVKTS